jgi:Flp pilus assembly pilin Flp
MRKSSNRTRTSRRTAVSAYRREEGAAMVEFALVLPLLLVLLIGIVEFGRAINYWIDANHLANVAARYAVVNSNPGPESTLTASVLGQANTTEFRDGGTTALPEGAKVCIDFPDGDGTPGVGDPVRATVTLEYNWMPFLGLNVTSAELRGRATMRAEALPTEYSDGECSGSA